MQMQKKSFEEIRTILASKTVGIAGTGGLGSNCAVALARVGMGRVITADFDTVSESNLNRQYFFKDQVGMKKVLALKENIARINPEVLVEAFDIKLDPLNIPQVFGDCDVIVEAFDLAAMKLMIAETVLEKMPGRILVMGNGVAGYGNNDAIKTVKSGNIYICGDQENETGENLPPLAPRVSIVAGMQANLVLEILLG